MSNMSYCRFSNTLTDLLDCQEALEAGGGRDLSPEEAHAASCLIEACRTIAEAFPEGQVIPGDWHVLRRIAEEGPLTLAGRDLCASHRLSDAGYCDSATDNRALITATQAGIEALERAEE